jgi:hypothetical protein
VLVKDHIVLAPMASLELCTNHIFGVLLRIREVGYGYGVVYIIIMIIVFTYL